MYTRTIPPSHTRTSQMQGGVSPQPNGMPIPAQASVHHPSYYGNGVASPDARVYANGVSNGAATLYPPPGNAGWPQSTSMPNISSVGEPMDIVSPTAEQPMEGVVQQTAPTVDMDEPGALPTNKSGMFGSLGFRKKAGWGLGKFVRNGEKAPVLPTVDEIVSNPTTFNGKRPTSGSSGGRSFDGARQEQQMALGVQQDPKKAKKEAERMAREAEKQRRELVQRNAREASRAVMAKRQMMQRQGEQTDTENVEWWKVASYIGGGDEPSQADALRHPTSGGMPAANPSSTVFTSTSDFSGFKGKQPASGVVRQHHYNPGHSDTANAAGARFASPPAEDRSWRDERFSKTRRPRDMDEYSISSSDVHSVSHVSAISFATVDSDPGPMRHRRGPSAYSMPRMTSTSSLRTSFDTSVSADFAQSVRSSNSFSLEHQLVEDLARARLGQQAQPGTLSPPPLNTLSLSPSMPAWQSPGSDSISPTSPVGHGLQPAFIPLSPPHMSSHHLHPRSGSPYEHGGQPVYMGPPSPGYAPKSAVNPMFQVVSLV